MAEAVRGVLREGLAERVALVAHCHGPTPHEDDRVATRALAERLQGLPVRAVEEDLAPRELVALYGRARAVVGTRFHSVIFALAAGTPAFAVSYFGPKAQGIMDMLGMSELCADTAGFRAAQALPRMRGLVEPAHRADVRERVARLRGELRHAVAERVIPRGVGEEAA
jgi:colanic acid/amylovoran biosynthesis protein